MVRLSWAAAGRATAAVSAVVRVSCLKRILRLLFSCCQGNRGAVAGSI
jgi:hypothetical protein